jgi:hypothetical protein
MPNQVLVLGGTVLIQGCLARHRCAPPCCSVKYAHSIRGPMRPLDPHPHFFQICKKRPKYQDDQPACFPCAINSAKGYSSRRAGSNIVDSSAPALTKRPPPPLCVVRSITLLLKPAA